MRWEEPAQERLRELYKARYRDIDISAILSRELETEVTPRMVNNAVGRYCGDLPRRLGAPIVTEGEPSPREVQPVDDEEQKKVEHIADMMRKEVRRMTPHYPAVKIRKAVKSDVCQLYEVGDIHFGGNWGLADTFGLGEYNIDICHENWKRYTEEALHLTEIDRLSHKIERCAVFALGDNVEGTAIFRGQADQVDMGIFVQFVSALDQWSRFIYYLAERFKEVRVYGVMGNHGRMGQRGEFGARANWDYLLYQWLCGRCEDLKNVHVFPSDSRQMAFYIPGFERWTHVIFHGDKIRSWQGIPWYGIDRAVQRVSGLLGRWPNYVHLGHFHQRAETPMFRGKKVINGSFCGPSPYGVDELMQADCASQEMNLLHKEHGIVAGRTVMIREPKELLPDAEGIMTPWSRIGDKPMAAVA